MILITQTRHIVTHLIATVTEFKLETHTLMVNLVKHP